MYTGHFPKQKLSYKQKTKKWRKENVDWADSKSIIYDNTVRKSFYNKKINYDLYNQKVHLDDMKLVLNPFGINADFIPNNIQHYPILINPINVLVGEEAKRRFDFKVIVTNPNAISEKEKEKKAELSSRMLNLLQSTSSSEEDLDRKLQELDEYGNFEWQDFREMRATELLNHYIKELDVKRKFNQGFKDGLISGEELYRIDIVSGEPIFEKLNPRKVFALRSGYSNRIEDADIVIIEDYWNPGKIVDTYYDKLKPKDIEKIEEFNIQSSTTDDLDNIDERDSFIHKGAFDNEGNIIEDFIFSAAVNGYNTTGYYDNQGNVRVIQVFWKSKRKVQKVKKYNEEGKPYHEFHTEDYIPNKDLGEESETFWINEAWEGVKIGKDIYVNMRPREIQYNRISNPSRCHFGIIGSVYNTNETRVISLVDRMKPYQYLYDVLKDRLNKAIARNLGKILEMDFAKVPTGWDVQKWLHYIKQDGIAVIDSFKEGNKGMAQGKLAGHFNTSGNVMDAETGAYIQQHIELLEYIKTELNEISGVTRQRQGQISNRETVGGIERSVAQSSHITEEFFAIHDNVKKRALECLLETSKIAMKGVSKKFQYITSNYSMKMVDIEGDEFSEADYGILVDDDSTNNELEQNLHQLAHAALQNQMLSFSTIMDIYTSQSLSCIRRKIEKDEQKAIERESQTKDRELQVRQQEADLKAEMENRKLEIEANNNIRDNETKLRIAMMNSEEGDAELESKKLELQKTKQSEEQEFKNKDLAEKIRHNKATEGIGKLKQNNNPPK